MLSRTSEYALRAMAHVATLPEGEAVSAAALADAADVPLAYLSKVLRRLVVAGLLTSEKGHGGGFRLARAPEDVRFSEILAASETGPEPVECAFGWGRCDAQRPCPLHPSWSSLKEAFAGWAEGTTLADVRAAGRRAASRRPERRTTRR